MNFNIFKAFAKDPFKAAATAVNETVTEVKAGLATPAPAVVTTGSLEKHLNEMAALAAYSKHDPREPMLTAEL